MTETELSLAVRRGLANLACCGGRIGHHFDCTKTTKGVALFKVPTCDDPNCSICMMGARHGRNQ